MSETDARGLEDSPTDSGSSTVSSSSQIDRDDLYEALANSRRRNVIRALEEGPREIGAIARAIAADELEIPVADVDATQRKRVYISLYQVHLDKLDSWGIVEWGETGDAVGRGPAYDTALEAMRAVAETDSEPESLVDRAKSALWGDA